MKKMTGKPKAELIKGKLLLIDGHNLLHRSFHKFHGMRSRSGIPTGAIFGFFRSLTPLIYKYQPKRIIVVFDADRPKFRQDLYPTYKAGRTKLGNDKESMISQLKAIKRMLKYLGIDCINDTDGINDWEADDYITYITIHSPFKKNIVLSSDKDYNQLLSKRTSIYNPNPKVGTLITPENVKQYFGYEADQTVDYLVMVGDSSDNIKGVPGYGEKKSMALLEKYGSLQKAIDEGGLVLPKSFPDDCEVMEVIRRNRMLIDTKMYVSELVKPNGFPINASSRNNINKDKLQSTIEKYGLNSFRKAEFIDAYKQYNKDKIKWEQIKSYWLDPVE